MFKVSFAAALIGLVAATAVEAATIPYQNQGTENPTTYTFTANSNGSLLAYFYGSGASFSESLGLLVNGVDRGTALDNHGSPFGTMYNFGNVNIGDKSTSTSRRPASNTTPTS